MSVIPKISVRIPTYNCAHYLQRTIESVLAQDIDLDLLDIEVIDDASQDDPQAVVEKWGQGRVRFFQKPENQGLTANFNTCLERAKGEIVHLLHGDDYLKPGFYRSVLDAFEKHPDIALYVCPSEVVDENDDPVRTDWIHPLTESGKHEQFFHLLVPSNPVRTPSAVIPAWAYEKIGNFDTRVSHTTDWHMWLKAASVGPVYFEQEPLTYYRFHSGAGSRGQLGSGNYLVEYYNCRKAWLDEHCPTDVEDYRQIAEDDLIDRAIADFRNNRETPERSSLLLSVFENRIPDLYPRFAAALRSYQLKSKWNRIARQMSER